MSHIILESKGKTSLLVKYPEKYLLVVVDKQLTQTNEERLLAGCSDAVLAEVKSPPSSTPALSVSDTPTSPKQNEKIPPEMFRRDSIL